MESLALIASLIVIFIYLLGVIAFIASWLNNTLSKLITNVFGVLSIFSGAWLWLTLSEGNGFFLGITPISLGAFGILNNRRRAK
jgi:hypothetical protein